MAEGIAFDLVTGVLGKLGSALWDEIGLLWSFKDDADDLKRQLEKIQAVLLDAEERSSVEIGEARALRIWLRELKGAAYDIDDLLDEIRTQALLRKQQRELQNQNQLPKMVCDQFLSCANPINLMFKFKMARRMKELRANINKIAKQRDDFGLVQAGTRRQSEMIVQRDDRETDSSVEKEKIVGRGDDIEEIVKLLLETNGHHDLSVIPIVGMGGLGKTTLAQVAFNDGRVTAQQVFDLRVWVYVSTDFDVKKIAEAVKSTTRGEGDLSTKESSNKFLLDTFSQKKFLLVLDDVWNEEHDKWDDLKKKFKDAMKGSKILVTTRNEKVAKIMKTVEPHRVRGLSDDDCWTLFKKRAFEEGEENDYPHLVEIGKQIVNKCGGLPLAVNALGSMMRCKSRTENAWSAIRDSEIWRLEQEGTILPSLKLSYIQMPSALKRCFAYCSIFPKDYEIYKDDLIRQWIALGFISSHEDIGNEYFDELLWRSFLQDKETYRGVVTCRMHDLVHDLAQSVAREEVAVIIGEDSTSIPEGCRYASIHSRSIQQVPTTVKQRLRALRFRESASLTTFYSEAKCLRLLDLNRSKISVLPSSIGKLKFLRYLDLSWTDIKELPESITGLCNLQTLILSFCQNIHTLPKFLGRLANLRILNLSECSRLLSLPSSLCQLKNLHDLNLSDLGDLQALPESIGNLENLRILNLSECSRLLSLPSSLCQLKNLHDLNLSDLGDLQALPESIGNLENLRFLNLSECSRLLSLPSSLCQLKNLHDLNLSNLGDLQALPKSIGNLENLRILNLSKCSRLLSLPSSLCQLKNLHDLNLSNLGDLQALPEFIGNLKNLCILNLSECSCLQSLPSSLCQLKNLHDLNLSKLHDLQALPEFIGSLKNLRYLNLSECSSLLSLPSSSSELRQLEKLDISDCKQLCELPKMIEKLTELRELLNKDCLELKGMPRGIGKLVSLSELSVFVVGKQNNVKRCASISELEHLKLVGKLEIKGLENVTNPVDAKAANLIEKKNLQSLKLKWNVFSAAEDMDTVQSAEEMDAVLENLQPHQNLEKLVIEGYAGEKFPSWVMNRIDSCLPNLVEIKLMNIPRCSSLPPLELLSVLKYISIENMPRCSYLPPLGQLPLLEELSIRNMGAITNLGVEFDGDSHINESANKFPALRRLELSDMPVLREWVTHRRNKFPALVELTLECMPVLREWVTVDDEEGRRERVPLFPCLDKLWLQDCPQLRPEPCLPASVQKLIISRTSEENLSLILERATMDIETPLDVGDGAVSLQLPNEGLRLGQLTIRECQQVTCLPESLRSLTSLQSLTIKDCEDLERIEDWLGKLTKLKYLNIEGCSSLRYLPIHKMTTLEVLSIEDCPLLFNAGGDVRVNERPEPCLPTSLILKHPTMDSETPHDDGYVVLWRLVIKNCQQLTCLPEGLRSLTTLESLTIRDCEDLERIEDWLGELTKLNVLNIWNCRSLRYLPAHKMTTLWYLDIEDCPLLFNIDRQFVDTNVDHIENVQVNLRKYKHKKRVSNS